MGLFFFGPNFGFESFVFARESGRVIHFVKRQTTGSVWSLIKLTDATTNGRSVLGDLVDSVLEAPSRKAVFVSKTAANQ